MEAFHFLQYYFACFPGSFFGRLGFNEPGGVKAYLLHRRPAQQSPFSFGHFYITISPP